LEVRSFIECPVKELGFFFELGVVSERLGVEIACLTV